MGDLARPDSSREGAPATRIWNSRIGRADPCGSPKNVTHLASIEYSPNESRFFGQMCHAEILGGNLSRGPRGVTHLAEKRDSFAEYLILGK